MVKMGGSHWERSRTPGGGEVAWASVSSSILIGSECAGLAPRLKWAGLSLTQVYHWYHGLILERMRSQGPGHDQGVQALVVICTLGILAPVQNRWCLASRKGG